MKKISKVVNAVSVTSIILGLFSPTATVFADSNDSSVVKTESFSENTIENYEAYDKYVQVDATENQFVISDTGKKYLPENVLTQIEKKLAETNKEVKNEGFIIDPETKAIVNVSPYVNFAAGVKGAARLRSGCYVRWFWWGFRFYFTSNAAVNWFRGILGGASSGATIGSLVAGATGHGLSATTIEAFGMYSDSMSRDLYNYNAKHRHSKIYMDLNGTFQYSFHTF